MSEFSIESFATECKEAMDQAEDRRGAARECLARAIERHGAEEIIEVLSAAIPAGASVGEMIVHRSPTLTMLYARLPPRFQSGIHNHTVCACIGPLVGEERNTIFEKQADGTVKEVRRLVAKPGEVLELERDVIHCIENPTTETSHALHLYAGDFVAIQDRRSLWSSRDHSEKSFTFPELLRESAEAMRESGNQEGLDALGEAIPAARPMIEALGA
jgi:predicted metal-dependent enzyme (double-stranded beta helix superfamily)